MFQDVSGKEGYNLGGSVDLWLLRFALGNSVLDSECDWLASSMSPWFAPPRPKGEGIGSAVLMLAKYFEKQLLEKKLQ